MDVAECVTKAVYEMMMFNSDGRAHNWHWEGVQIERHTNSGFWSLTLSKNECGRQCVRVHRRAKFTDMVLDAK